MSAMYSKLANWCPQLTPSTRTHADNPYNKGQIPLRYLVADSSEAGRRPVAR